MKAHSKKDAIELQRELYNEKIRQDASTAYGRGVLQELYYEQRVRFALRYLPPNGRVLDLGCGDGTITHAIAQKSSEVVAFDVSEAAIELARQKHPAPNITYRCGAVEEAELQGPFDEVTMFEVLEHVFDADAVLTKIRSLLRTGGVLVLSTPNRARLDPILLTWYCKLKGLHFEYEEDEDHVREYSYHDVLEALHRNGFELRKVEALYLSMKIAFKFPMTRRWQKLLTLTGKLWPHRSHHLYFAAKKI